MQISTVLRQLLDTLLYYKIFSIPLVLMLFILLVRVPLGTFSQASILDPIAHFILPATTGALLFALLVRSRFFKAPTRGNSLLIILLLGVMVEVIWEIIEYIVDLTLRLNWQLGNADTMGDLILAVVGSSLAGYLFVKLYQPADS